MSQNKRSRDQEEEEKDASNDEAAPKKKSAKPVEETKPPAGDDLDVSGTNPTPIFLKKTYKMIDSCDPEICTWSSDGLSFIVKDPEKFAAEIIPQYFDHNKFSSFARQLNFYGFRKIQTKPIKNSDFDETTAKHVTFFNEKFRKGRQDLLREITRSTRSAGGGGGGGAVTSGGKDLDSLRATVATLEQRVAELETKLTESNKRVDMIVMELTASRSQQQQAMFSAQMAAASMGAMPPGLLPPATLPSANVAAAADAPGLPSSTLGDAAACTLQNVAQKSFGSVDENETEQQQPLPGSELVRAFSLASARSRQLSDMADLAPRATAGPSKTNGGNSASQQKTGKPADEKATANDTPATLPPHPKQKKVPPQHPTAVQTQDAQPQVVQPQAAQPQGATTIAGANAALALPLMLRNAWENDFFNTLMADGAASRAASLAGFAGNSALGTPGGLSALAAAQQQMAYPAYLQNRAMQNAMAMGGVMLPPGMHGMQLPRNGSLGPPAALPTALQGMQQLVRERSLGAAAAFALDSQMNSAAGAPPANTKEV